MLHCFLYSLKFKKILLDAHTKISVRIYWSPRKWQNWLNFRQGIDRDIEPYRNKWSCAPIRTFIFNLNFCGNKNNWILYLLCLQELYFHQGFSETLLAKLRASGRLYVRTMRQRVMRQRHWKIKRKYLSVGRKPNMNTWTTHVGLTHTSRKFTTTSLSFHAISFECNIFNAMSIQCIFLELSPLLYRYRLNSVICYSRHYLVQNTDFPVQFHWDLRRKRIV